MPELTEFGCAACWPADADGAWDAVSMSKIDHELEDDWHFSIKLRSCRACGQHFVSAFCETVDWADGEDPQFWCVVPLTEAETQALLAAGPEFESTLFTVTAGRRSLCHDNPKRPPARSYWSAGLVLAAHD